MSLSPVTASPTTPSDTPLIAKTNRKSRCAMISDLFNRLMSKIATHASRLVTYCIPCLASRIRQDLETPDNRESSFSREDSFFYDPEDN